MTLADSPELGGAGANLYEVWVRNPLVGSLLGSPTVGASAVRTLQLLPHVLRPMVRSAWLTTCERLTVEEICHAQSGYFRAVQAIFPSARASLLVRCCKLLATLPLYGLRALLAQPGSRPFVWSLWWWSASLPLLAPGLPRSAAEVNEEPMDDSAIHAIQPLFRGVHQMVELVCYLGVRLIGPACQRLEAGDGAAAVSGMLDTVRLFHCMTPFLNILAQLDTKAYQEFRPALKGTSGGDSVNLRAITKLCRSFALDGGDISEPEDVALLNAVHSLQYSVGLFWSAHLALAVNANGADSAGTQGTSIPQMFVHLEGILDTRLNRWIPRFAASCKPRSVWIEHEGSAKEVGVAIRAAGSYVEVSAPPPRPLVDRPSELFEDSWRAYFQSQSMAPPLQPALVSLAEIQKRHAQRLNLGHFYSKVVPELEATVLKLLHLEPSHAAVAVGANLSEFLFRLLWAVQDQAGEGEGVVVSTDADFLSFRAAWRALQRRGWVREQAELSDTADLAQPVIAAIQKHGRRVKLVHISAVTSVQQYSLTEREMASIVDAAREVGAVVVVDACQGFCNVDHDFGQVARGALRDVFVLGTCVKHARSLEGVGWCAFDPNSSLRDSLPSGWCGDLASIDEPLHEPRMGDLRGRMFGGTVANAVNAEYFVRQQSCLEQLGVTVRQISDRVARLQSILVSRLQRGVEQGAGNGANGHSHEAAACELAAGFAVVGRRRHVAHPTVRSKVLVLDCAGCAVSATELAERLGELGFRLDSRHGRFLRLGLDFCHSEKDVAVLADAVLFAASG